MTEVRDVMSNYANCPDPTESAARRERFRQKEEASEVEETAALMLRGSVNANLSEVELDSPRQNLSPTPTRVPTLMRLGPIMDNEDDLRGSGTADLLEKELDFPRHNPSPTLPQVLMRLGSIMENEDDPMIPLQNLQLLLQNADLENPRAEEI
ncbi:hypothetical protein DY000_02030934 [Brassica cretica]|uniref:IBB domain-containing protein n=1 Tax=Brassica cretica TaxID=69181 RepID=A0ABQ7DMD4_BRACR|nr:hypothetical protein DY000_02030934 [Brassica cretica]